MNKRGFTLIELLVVISIIAILSTVVFVALNPSGRFADARNSRRFNDVNNYITAIHECIVDAGGATSSCLGSIVDDEVYEIVDTGIASACDDVCTSATSDTHCAALDSNLASFLADLPTDPGGVTTGHTEYTVSLDTDTGIVTVAACSAEDSVSVQVSR